VTYKVLTSDTNKVIFRSELRSAESPSAPNKRVSAIDGDSSTAPTIIKSTRDDTDHLPQSDNDIGADNSTAQDVLASASAPAPADKPTDILKNEKDLIGRTFLLP